MTLAERTIAPDRAGIARMAESLTATTLAVHVVGVSQTTSPAGVLGAEHGASWVLGRYAGQLTLDGRSYALEPQIGWNALDGWVTAATDLPVPAAAGEDERARVSALASMLWVRAVDDASRHGPPAFRRDIPHEGGSVRGRLDVRRTVRLRAKGQTSAASVYRARELDNPVTRIIMAADRVLMRQLGEGRWRTDRVDQVMAQLQTAVGKRSPIPRDGELHRMRYTPITRPFKWAAELSSRIVRQDPVATTALAGRIQGLVLDLEGIYTEATLNWARDARPDLRAERVGSGQAVLWDRHRIRATLDLRVIGAGSGAPVLELCIRDEAPERLDVSADAHEAAAAVRHAVAAI